MVQINVGTSANDNTGDTLRAAFQKVNANTTELGVSITTSSDSIFNGVKVGRGSGNHISNTMLGFATGLVNAGNFNTFLGADAGVNNSTGNYNTFIGSESAYNNTIGNSNTFIGSYSGTSNSSGIGNTFIGTNSGNTSNYNNCSTLGYNAQVTGSNQVQLGDSLTTTYVYGTVQNRSDLRDKADVQDTVLGLDFISKLRPVDYKWDMRESYKSELPEQGELSDEDFKVVMDLWLEENKLSNLKHDGTKKRNRFHHGFIAQEVKDLGFGGFQDHSVNGGEDVLSIGYDEFIAPMVKAIQELKAEIELLKVK